MTREERIVYHLFDGSIIEINGSDVIQEEYENGAYKYYLNSGIVLAVMDSGVTYYTIHKAPEGGNV